MGSYKVTEECWLVYPGPNVVDYNWSNKYGTRIGIDKTVSLIPGCHVAIPSDIESVDWYDKNLSPLIHVWKKQSYAKYRFKSMTEYDHTKLISGSIIIIALQLVAKAGGKIIHMVDCKHCEEYEAIKKVVDLYGLSLVWES